MQLLVLDCYLVKLILICLLYFKTAAAILFYGGAWIFKTYHHFDQLTTANITLIPASILIAVGIVLFIVGVVGIIAAGKENRWLLAAVSK